MKIHCCVLYVADAVAVSSTPDNEARLSNVTGQPTQEQISTSIRTLESQLGLKSCCRLIDPATGISRQDP
jgi:hypothetical protein